jgi:hypothetical protein
VIQDADATAVKLSGIAGTATEKKRKLTRRKKNSTSKLPKGDPPDDP